MDTDIGTELFAGYENDFKLIVADISSKLQALQDQDGEARKSSVRAAERAVEEAEEIVSPDSPIPRTITDTSAVDRSNGDGSNEHTQSTEIKSLRPSPRP
jgi:Vesicle transport v-SNARE protein N-terminus